MRARRTFSTRDAARPAVQGVRHQHHALIDVMLVLLIIFMVVTPHGSGHRPLPAGSAQNRPARANQVVLGLGQRIFVSRPGVGLKSLRIS
jgi:hypothetical protein